MFGTEPFKLDGAANVHQHSKLLEEFALVFSAFGDTSILTYHPIKDGAMGIGKPVSVPSVKALLNQIDADKETTTSAWADQDIIYSDAHYLVFKTNKGTVKPLWYRIGDRQICITSPLPTIVYVFDRQGSLKMFACDTDAVGAQTLLYVAPLFNTTASGNFCTGNAALPSGAASDTDIKAGVINCVFNSNFTHSSGGNYGFKGAKTEADHVSVWQLCADKKRAPSSRQLMKTEFTLSKILKAAN